MLALYSRYIATTIIPSLSMITFVITGMVWVLQIMKLLYLIDKGILFNQFLYLTFLVIPSLLFIVLPFVTMLAVIYTYQRLNEERQLISLKNAGLSNFQLAKPALIISVVMTIFSFYLSFDLMPSSYITLKSSLDTVKNNLISNIINEKTFNKISKAVTMYVDKKLPNGGFSGIVLFDHREKKPQPTILFADSGYLQMHNQNPVLRLKNGSRQAYDVNGNLTRLLFDSLVLELKYNLSDNIDKTIYNRDINEYYIHELLEPDARLSEQRKTKLRAEGHQRLIWASYNLIFTFVSLSVLLSYPDSKKIQYKPLLVTAAIILVITFCHFTLQNIASQNLNFIYATYANCIISMLGATYLYCKKSI